MFLFAPRVCAFNARRDFFGCVFDVLDDNHRSVLGEERPCAVVLVAERVPEDAFASLDDVHDCFIWQVINADVKGCAEPHRRVSLSVQLAQSSIRPPKKIKKLQLDTWRASKKLKTGI